MRITFKTIVLGTAVMTLAIQSTVALSDTKRSKQDSKTSGEPFENPLLGSWSCSQIIDGETVDPKDFWLETYGANGFKISDGESINGGWRKKKTDTYELIASNGELVGANVMKEKWLMVRYTAEHAYVCLRHL